MPGISDFLNFAPWDETDCRETKLSVGFLDAFKKWMQDRQNSLVAEWLVAVLPGHRTHRFNWSARQLCSGREQLNIAWSYIPLADKSARRRASIVEGLRTLVSEFAGRKAYPTAMILDSRTLQWPTESGARGDHDGNQTAYRVQVPCCGAYLGRPGTEYLRPRRR